jgi:hypothetical protein
VADKVVDKEAGKAIDAPTTCRVAETVTAIAIVAQIT